MSTNAHGAHAAQTHAGVAGSAVPGDGSHAVEAHTVRTHEVHHVAPQRPAARPLVAAEAVEPARPVDGWGFSNRVMILATLVVLAFTLIRVVLDPPTGSVVMGESGHGWVETVEGILFGLWGGALTAAFGYLVVLIMGGASRSPLRYIVGGVVGGVLAAFIVLFIFSNTAALTIGFHLLWLLPLAGLLGGLWAGVTSARHR